MIVLLAMLGCDNPINNAVFTADEDFLAALPGSTRLGFPANLRALPPDGEETLLPFAAEATEELGEVTRWMIFIGEVLRSTEPAERSVNHRVFSPRPLSGPDDRGVSPWWLRADLNRTSETADILWTLEGAPTPDGPWRSFASGRHSQNGLGSFEWNTPTLARITDQPESAPAFEVLYEDRNQEGRREVALTSPITVGLPHAYTFSGDDIFSFTGNFRVYGDEELPTYITLLVFPSGAGRSEGVVYEESSESPFITCWDQDGTRQYASGGLNFPSMGTESDCPLL